MALKSGKFAARYNGFDVIRDDVEIDETINPDDTITIERCFGSVLIEIPWQENSSLTRAEIFDRAEELADECISYGIAELSWIHRYEAGEAFLRFTVDAWKPISQAKRDEDSEVTKADDQRDQAREVWL